jgi:hypothetical protein
VRAVLAAALTLLGCDVMKHSDASAAPAREATRNTQAWGPSPVRGAPTLALAPGRIATLAGGGKLEVRKLPGLALETELEAQAVGTMPDGTLLALGVEKLCTLAPGAKDVVCRKKLTLIDGAVGWVWSDAAGGVWTLEGDAARRFVLEGEKARFTRELKLDRNDAGAIFAPLPDGGVLWSDGIALRHVDAAGVREWRPAAGTIVGVAAGAAGEAWVALANETLVHLKLGAKIEAPLTLKSERILSVAATATHVATVVGDPKVRTLVVRDASGQVLFQRPLPERARVFRVALSPFAPVVAVGGEGELEVWTLDGKAIEPARH